MPGAGLLHSAVHTILLQQEGGSGQDRTDDEENGSSTTGTTSSSSFGSQMVGAGAAEARAGALLVDALVLYLKALSVVGTAIKALRQVIDVIQAHWGNQHSVASVGNGLRLAAWQPPACLDGQAGGCGSSSGSGSSAGLSSSRGSLQERITSLQGWLELHFSIILDRAQECRLQMKKQQQQEASGAMEDKECAASMTLVTRSAEELLYKHALSLAKDGAVKELVGQSQGALEYYAQAKLTMEALLAEPLLPQADQQLLERYCEELAASCARLVAAASSSSSSSASGVTAAALTFGGGGGGNGGS